MATGQNPSVEVGSAPDHPPPCPAYGEKWVHRVYQRVKQTTNTASGSCSFSAADFGIPGTFYMDKLQVWKLTQQSGPGLTGYFYQANVSDLSGDTVVATDFGTATSLAGMTYKLPLGHAKGLTASVGAQLIDCNPAVVSTSTYPVDSYVCNLHCWVSL